MQEKNDKRHCPKNNLLLSSLSSPLSPRLYSSALLLFVNLFVTPLHKTLLYSPLPHLLQADTNSRLNRTIAQSYPVLCHPAIFISVQADALHEKLHQKKYHLPESLTSPPNVPLPLKKFLHSQSGRPT